MENTVSFLHMEGAWEATCTQLSCRCVRTQPRMSGSVFAPPWVHPYSYFSHTRPCARKLTPRSRFAVRLRVGTAVFNDPPGCGTSCVCVCPCVRPCALSCARPVVPSAGKAASRRSLRSVNNFQWGVTPSGKAFSTLSAGNWAII